MTILRQLNIADADLMLELLNDPASNKHMSFNSKIFSKIDIERFIINSQENSSSMHLAIIDEKGLYAGTVSLKNIDFIHSKAEYAIILSQNHIGKGLAKLATDSILGIAFNVIGLELVELNVKKSNLRAINFYHKMNFINQDRFDKNELIWFEIRKSDAYKSNLDKVDLDTLKSIRGRYLG